MQPKSGPPAAANIERAADSADAIERRTFLQHAAGGLATLAAATLMPSLAGTAAAAEPGSTTYIYTGSFTTRKRGAKGDGINVYRMDQPAGEWTLVQVLETIENPQFICFDRTQKFIYAVHGDGTEVSAYAIDGASGKIAFLNRQPTNGVNSTHLTPDPTNRYIVIGNGPGIAVFPRNADGTLAPFTDMVPAPGEVGPHRNQREGGPHPHYVSFDPGGRFLVAPDRGVDRIHIYRLDTANGKLIANDPGFVRTRSGAGPRHLAFHPAQPWAYLADELDSTVTAYNWNAERGEFKPFEVITTLPTTYTGDNSPSEIFAAPSGKFVYVSNRGHNSIAVFSVDPASGALAPVGWESTRGKTPRFFALAASGSMLYAANLDSHNIVAFRVDQQTGKLAATGQVVETGSPSCILFSRA
jgi:6-phosphogluconolactonase